MHIYESKFATFGVFVGLANKNALTVDADPIKVASEPASPA